MARPDFTSKTGHVDIVRQGHTATDQYGDGPTPPHTERSSSVRDLKPGTSK